MILDTCRLSFPRYDPYFAVMKSMQISSHFHWDTSRGWRSLAGFWCYAFTLLHTSQQLTKYAISFFIPSHQNIYQRSMYILIPPGCIEYEDSCASAKIFFLKYACSGTHIRPQNLIVPCGSLEKSWVVPSCRCLIWPCRVESSAWAMRISSSRVGAISNIFARPASTITKLSSTISCRSSGGKESIMAFKLVGLQLRALATMGTFCSLVRLA